MLFEDELHDIAEILLNVTLSINQSIEQYLRIDSCLFYSKYITLYVSHSISTHFYLRYSIHNLIVSPIDFHLSPILF